MKRGYFVTFEGIDGSGKTSQIGRLADYIRGKNKYQDVLLTREPTWRAEELKKKLQNDAETLSDGLSMAQLFVEDRKIHTNEQIVPALEQNVFVICDRYALSTCAYQLTQGVNLDVILELHEIAGTIKPDVTFYIDVPLQIAEERMQKRGENREKFEKSKTFTQELTLNYHYLTVQSASDERIRNVIGNVICIDGKSTIEVVEKQVRKEFDRLNF